ncbi:DUF3883 domain-containing protein [Burkholderia sp. Bp8963]|uniref:DUF3883 domain-containing protein n=1 Tax=Burkholderia sp. Bp8963 TaxID=2184547 RepID=UPI000F5A063A|nr:DUF3883 domain-containing protein [Burkholderia sp. Bp8963]RQS57258.1 DUF3883 domain-containing protein [Burkholderia sp. Bp8963]
MEWGKAASEPGKELFAFLPVRDFGFRFYIQADFLLSSSREDVLDSRPWNQTLRDSIAAAFVRAVEQIRNTPNSIVGYLRYLPEGTEITHRFFAPVVDQLFAALSETECIPCATGQWRKPADVLLPPAQFAQLVSAEDSLRLFGKDYPADDVGVSRDQLKALGCRDLMGADIVMMFSKYGEWLLEQGLEWMVEFYDFVASGNRTVLLECGLADAPVVLDAKGQLLSPKTSAIFYPLAVGKVFGFEQDLDICHETVANAIAAGRTSVRSLFDDLGVRPADPYQLIVKHILPKHEGDGWKSASQRSKIGHLRYIKEKRSEFLAGARATGEREEAVWKKLCEILWIGSKARDQRWTFWRPAQMYLSSEYLPEFDIENLLGDGIDKSRLVSPLYLQPADSTVTNDSHEIADWRAFLLALGVNPSPRIMRRANQDIDPSDELKLLLEHQSIDVRRSTLECLDRNWKRYPSSPTFTPSGKWSTQQYTLIKQLRATVAPTKRRTSTRLDQSFCDTQELRDALGNSPCYVDADLEDIAFMGACGIRHQPDIATCVGRLLQLKERDKCTFDEVRPIYRFMEHLCATASVAVKSAFEDNPIILTGGEANRWKRVSEVVWSRQGEFLDRLYPSIQAHYRDYQAFFVSRLGVPLDVPTAGLIRALPLLEEADLRAESKVGEAMRIYSRANHEIDSGNGDGSLPAWLSVFCSGQSFLSHRGRMVRNVGHLFVDDKPEISALFRDAPEISFVAIPIARLPQVRALFSAAKVPTLSASVSLSVFPVEGETDNVALTRRVSERLLLIARFVYSSAHAAYVRANQGGKWAELSMVVVVDVGALEVHVELGGAVARTTGNVLMEQGKIFVRRGSKGVVDRLASEICAFLGVPSGLADGVSRILSEQHMAGAEEFLEVKGVRELPAEEQSRLFEQSSSRTHEPSAADSEVSSDVEPLGHAKTSNAARPLAATARAPSSEAAPKTSEGGPSRAPASTLHAYGGSPSDENVARSSATVSLLPGSGTTGSAVDSAPTSTAASALPPSNGGVIASKFSGINFSPVRRGTPVPSSIRTFGLARPWRGGADKGRRLVSYVEPSTRASSSSTVEEDTIKAVERAAVDFFLSSQAANWTSLEEMPPLNKGYDVRGISFDGSEHFIELKGQSGAWTAAGVSMTPAELLCAAEHNDCYWLCVVEHALDENRRRLYIIQNPFGGAGQFRYDSGWKDVAISERSAALTPAAGLKIVVKDVGEGMVAEVVKKGGAFSRIKIKLDDGREIVRVFNPATMQLSREEDGKDET